MHKERKWRMYFIAAWLVLMLVGTFINVNCLRGLAADLSGHKFVQGEASIIDKIPDSLLHGGSFFVLALMLYSSKKRSPKTLVALAIFAVMLEVIQPLSGVRLFQASDITSNLLGLAAGAGLMELIRLPKPKKPENNAMAPVRS